VRTAVSPLSLTTRGHTVWDGERLLYVGMSGRAMVGEHLEVGAGDRVMVKKVAWGLLDDSCRWFVISALALFFGYDQASKQPHFFRRRLLAAISISVFLEFLANLFVLNLIAELALQPFLLLLGLLIAVAESDERLRALRTHH
jgi:hypothetical protein